MPDTNTDETNPHGYIRCMTCGYVLGTNYDCNTCYAERVAAAKAKR